jgi:coenzyme F420-0:L-glutamate ligase / coenzyme F420-1:gamma-L-glutamate ligase
MNHSGVHIIPIHDLPEISPGDDLAGAIIRATRASSLQPGAQDIFVVAQKIVSKAEGRVVRLDSVEPSDTARDWAEELGKDPRLVEIILSEMRRVVRRGHGILIVETRHGFVCANAGVDVSNTPEGTAILLPRDPDDSARRLKSALDEAFGVSLGVIISDTFGRPWREGLVNVSIGVAGISPLLDYRGHPDAFGRTMQASVLAVADELASAAELVMGKTSAVPVAVIQGYAAASGEGSARDLIRLAERDLFR